MPGGSSYRFRSGVDRLAKRVAARHLVAITNPKDMLRTLESYARKIEPMLRDESRVEELKALYLRLAGELRPLAAALEGVLISRPDEAKKLKNLQGWLRTVERRTRPNLFDDAERIRDVQIAVSMYLEDLEGALKSIVRSGPRIEGYAKIERKVQHGPYTIINNFGFRPEEIAEPLQVLDDATRAIQSAGFGAFAYGDVLLQTTKAGWAGMYRDSSDDIQLNVTARHRFDSVYTLVHELGHRVWHKQLSGAQRDAYEDAYVGNAKPIPLAQREAFWTALEGSDFDPKRARGSLPKDLQGVFSEYWKDRTKVTLAPTVKGVSENRDMFYRGFVLPRTRYYLIDRVGIASVTDYGATKVEEDFAEVFAHYCLGKPLTPDAQQRFKDATGKG